MEILGSGTFGTVYKAFESRSKKHWALKFMNAKSSEDDINGEVSIKNCYLHFNFIN